MTGSADLEWIRAIRPLTAPVRGIFGGVEVWTASTTFAPFTGERLDNHAYDCAKKGNLVAGPDGQLSCAEIAMVRRFLASDWNAGWVATCGQRNDDWRSLMLVPVAPANPTMPVPPLLPPRLASILVRHGESGYPDIIAWQSPRRPRLVEMKGPGDRGTAQAAWLRLAFAAGTIAPEDFLLVTWAFG